MVKKKRAATVGSASSSRTSNTHTAPSGSSDEGSSSSSCSSSGSGEVTVMENDGRLNRVHKRVSRRKNNNNRRYRWMRRSVLKASQLFCRPLRSLVSQNRRRYQQDGYDLDLTYITDRIIAMGYPADTGEALYRNSMNSIVDFLENRHFGHYMVFNLRGQYVYDTSKFHNRVLSFEMVDHHPPRLEIMAPFCREVHDYLTADLSNIVAVHCKAGKGRTGVMICAYLCYINFYPLPRQNMDYYSIVRTLNNKGVTIPSQRRYVYYFAHLRHKQLNYMPLRVELVGIYLERPPRERSFMKKTIELRVVNGDVDVYNGEGLIMPRETWEEEEEAWGKGIVSKGEDSYDPDTMQGKILSRRGFGWTIPKDKRVFLEGDVRIELHSAFTNQMRAVQQFKNKIGHCWFNTMFTCPKYCGGPYKHGDEAYPYPPGETTISVRRGNANMRAKSGSASVPSSPPSTPKVMTDDIRGGRRAPSFESRKYSRTATFSQINNAFRRLADGVSSSRIDEPGPSRGRNPRRNEIVEEEAPVKSDDDLLLLRPPGLDQHCTQESLERIYAPLKKPPPRTGIEEMLRHAHSHNLISDSYNERRLSVPQEGRAVRLAPQGRPLRGGPNCIEREDDEHVTVFSVIEMDDACKNKEIDPGFKVIVVTRCVREDIQAETRLTDKFLQVTREKQEVVDEVKRKKVEERMRKLQMLDLNPESDKSADEVCARKEEENARDGDPRSRDPYLKRFFYRQRADSLSRYPDPHHRCPLHGAHSLPLPPQEDSSSKEEAIETSRWKDESTPGPSWQVPRTSNGSVSDLDLEVRSYHPNEEGKWDDSVVDNKWKDSEGSASSSVSSQSDQTGVSAAASSPAATASTVSAPAILPS